MPPISTLIKPASGNCNMTCDYCFYCDEQSKRQQASYGMMSEETLENLLRKIIYRAEGSCSIAFQGGEPTLCGLNFYKKAVALVQQYNHEKQLQISYAFQTNGTNITEEWCRFFKQNNFLVGISLDGTWKTHDKYRHFRSGEGTFDRVLETCKMLDTYQIPYNILTVVNAATAREVRQIYKFYHKKGFDYQQYIPCLDPVFEEQGQMPYSLSPKAYGTFLVELFQLWHEDYKNGHEVFIRQFDNYAGILKGYLPEACDQRGCCGIQYVIEADGSVYPCDFYVLDPYYLGNINRSSLQEMDEKRQELGFLEESFKLSEKCRQCPYLGLCRNGCQRNRIKCSDGTYQNYFCESYQMFFESCMEQLKELAR
ncbi:MAG: anaerobic sulfatase maturase [Lachnospiraceae bacterium]|nr:anaerobic sulfatase maturase [Lachnospiraceae bacterium]MDD3795179.1 anaerobic sulfatase maturase [Lachnospiraceae bacterium]